MGKSGYDLGGDNFDIDGVGVGGAEGEGGGVPDGVDDDVVDWMEWTVAVPTDKEAAREGGTELGGGQPGDGVNVVAADEAEKEGPHSPGIACPPPKIRLLLSDLLGDG